MNNTFQILQGHFLDVAREIPDASIQTCVTSPPYYGLRSYNTEPQIWDAAPGCDHTWQDMKQYKDSWRRGEEPAQHHSGRGHKRTPEELKTGRWTFTEYCLNCGAWRGELGQEPSPALYIRHLMQVFSEVWRTLRPDGTVWVNIGDAYYNYRPSCHDDARATGYHRAGNGNARDTPSAAAHRSYKVPGLKEKDLIGLPWMFAFAMREAGWYWRSEIHWVKPNPLSESVEDRPTKAHEAVLMFAKREKYYYDKWAITELPSGNAHPRYAKGGKARSTLAKGFDPQARSANGHYINATQGNLSPGGRNKRTVWTIGVQAYAEDHFAAYPEQLPEIPIKAGSSEVGCCAECGAPWRRIVLKAAKPIEEGETLESRWRRAAEERGIDIDQAVTGESITLGWRRGCKCYKGAPVPSKVLDPFTGRGTTGVVAVRFGRDFVGVELQGRYVSMIRKNLNLEAPLWVSEATS